MRFAQLSWHLVVYEGCPATASDTASKMIRMPNTTVGTCSNTCINYLPSLLLSAICVKVD